MPRQAIVLVGGEGTRLRPLTEAVPKPALTLVDRPFLAHMIEWLAGHGVEEVVLACGFLPDVLREALAGEEERAGVRIRYAVEPRPLGTAGAIRFAAESLGADLDDTFLALNGDVLTDLDLGALAAAHRDGGGEATIALHKVADSSAFGLVERTAGGEVLSFREKTGEAVPGEVNAGMYALERTVLERIPAGRAVSIERDVFPQLVGAGLRALPLSGYWVDIGTPERYLAATWDILEGAVATRVEVRPDAVLVAPDATVAGAEIGPRAVVGPGCEVGPGAVVTETVMLAGSRVGEGATVTGSALAPGATVAPGAVVERRILAPDEKVAGA